MTSYQTEVSPNENNVILYINGTSRSNNLTIILLLCGHNVISVVSRASAHGRSTINLRRFMGVEWRLESFGKFIYPSYERIRLDLIVIPWPHLPLPYYDVHQILGGSLPAKTQILHPLTLYNIRFCRPCTIATYESQN